MNKRGMLLIELLVAASLFSLGAAGAYHGLMQTLQTEKRVLESFDHYDPVRILGLQLEKDLRNTVDLKDYPFQASSEDMKFPMVRMEAGEAGERARLYRVHYQFRNRQLVRSEEELTASLVKEKKRERAVLQNVRGLEFRFSFRDQDNQIFFEPFWLEDPYYGIPRAVRVDLSYEIKGKTLSFSKWVSLPQGRWGSLAGIGSDHLALGAFDRRGGDGQPGQPSA